MHCMPGRLLGPVQKAGCRVGLMRGSVWRRCLERSVLRKGVFTCRERAARACTRAWRAWETCAESTARCCWWTRCAPWEACPCWQTPGTWTPSTLDRRKSSQRPQVHTQHGRICLRASSLLSMAIAMDCKSFLSWPASILKQVLACQCRLCHCTTCGKPCLQQQTLSSSSANGPATAFSCATKSSELIDAVLRRLLVLTVRVSACRRRSALLWPKSTGEAPKQEDKAHVVQP